MSTHFQDIEKCMPQPLVTVIIATYRKFENLKIAVNSIFKQNYSNIELIVSDDGSENFDLEHVQAILSGKGCNIRKVSIIHHPANIGTVKNFNNAIKQSSGEFVFLLAQDDAFCSADIFEKLVNSFGPSLVVSCLRGVYSEDGEQFIEKLPSKKHWRLFSSRIFYKFLIFRGNIISGSCTYYKREVFHKYGFFDETFRLMEDFPYFLELLRKKEQIKFIELETIRYKLGGLSNSKSSSRIIRDETNKLYQREMLFNCGLTRRAIQWNLERQTCERFGDKLFCFLKYFDVFLSRLFLRLRWYE